jgi:transcription termination factor NusB
MKYCGFFTKRVLMTVWIVAASGSLMAQSNPSEQTRRSAQEQMAAHLQKWAADRQAAAAATQEQEKKAAAQLKTATLEQLLGKQELDSGQVVEALTDAIITAKNKQLPDFIATATNDQKVDLLTAVEKQIARATAGIDEANAEASTAVSKGQDPVPFRKRVGQIKAYINVLNEIKYILEQS